MSLDLAVCDRCWSSLSVSGVVVGGVGHQGVWPVGVQGTNGVVACPPKYTMSGGACTLTWDPPPGWCPYMLEHAVAEAMPKGVWRRRWRRCYGGVRTLLAALSKLGWRRRDK